VLHFAAFATVVWERWIAGSIVRLRREARAIVAKRFDDRCASRQSNAAAICFLRWTASGLEIS